MAGFFSKEARVARKDAKAEVRLKKYEGAVNKAAGTQPPKFLSWRAISALFYLCEYSYHFRPCHHQELRQTCPLRHGSV